MKLIGDGGQLRHTADVEWLEKRGLRRRPHSKVADTSDAGLIESEAGTKRVATVAELRVGL